MSNIKSHDVYSAMSTGKPFKTYRKTVLGKLYLTILDPFLEKPEGILLEGNPKKKDQKCYIDVWSEKEDVFLKRMNANHFKAGYIIEVKERETPVKSPNELSDEEVEEIVNKPFMALKHALDAFTSTAPVYRLLEKARELEKSEKYIQHIESKLSEMQLAEFGETVNKE